MKTSERRKEYRRRIIDSTIETYLSVSGGISIDGPKGCGKTRTAAHHAGSVYPVGNPGNEHSKRKLAELQPCLVLRGELPVSSTSGRKSRNSGMQSEWRLTVVTVRDSSS